MSGEISIQKKVKAKKKILNPSYSSLISFIFTINIYMGNTGILIVGVRLLSI